MEFLLNIQRSLSFGNVEIFSTSFVVLPALALMIFLETLLPWQKPGKGRFIHIGRHLLIRSINLATTVIVFAFITCYLEPRDYFGLGLFWKLQWPFWLKTLVGFFALDLWLYLVHQANHRIPFLWRFHRVHHTDTQVDATTASRFHPGQVLLAMAIDLPFVSLVGFQPLQILYYIIAFRLIEIFQHSNIVFPEKLDQILRKVIVTPGFHRVHHSQNPSETNANFAVFFTFWDRIFVSARNNPFPRKILFGLDDYLEPKWQTLRGILSTPFFSRPSQPKLTSHSLFVPIDLVDK